MLLIQKDAECEWGRAHLTETQEIQNHGLQVVDSVGQAAEI